MRHFLIPFSVLLAACGGSVSILDASAAESSPSDAPLEAAPSDAGACTWVCNPSPWDADLYQNTCTQKFCPGTGGCASHAVPNPCAD
jgi:hypothetical protein